MPVVPLTSRLGIAAGQHDRLELAAVVVGLEVDGVLVDRGGHRDRGRRHPALGVAHRGGGVVGRAEVAVAVDQRQPHRPRLGHPDQGVVDRAVAVRVQPAHHLADDAGALHVAAVGAQAHVVHRVEDPALHRLEAVAGVGQGPGVDDRVGVLEERGLASRRRRRCRGCAPRSRRGGRCFVLRACHAADSLPPRRRIRRGHAASAGRSPERGRFRTVTEAPGRQPRRPAPLGGRRPAARRPDRAHPADPARRRRAAGRVLRPGLGRVEVLPVLLADAAALRPRRRPVHPRRPRRPGRLRAHRCRAR